MDREFEFHWDKLINPMAKKQWTAINEFNIQKKIFLHREKEKHQLSILKIVACVTLTFFFLSIKILGDSGWIFGLIAFLNVSFAVGLYLFLAKYYRFDKRRAFNKIDIYLRKKYARAYWKIKQTKALFGRPDKAKYRIHYLYPGCWN